MELLAKFLRVAFLFALLAVAAIAVPLQLFDHQGLDRVELLERELKVLRDTNHRIRRDNEALRHRIRAFHSDPEYIEKIARDELGMVRTDEVIYQFPNKTL